MNLCEKFDNINHLVLSFYSDGYTIAVKLNEFPFFTSETILETARISYEESSLLEYIENKELPPLLVDMIDRSPKLSQYKIWHNGCLAIEVRDRVNYTQVPESICHTDNCFVLLRPTNLSMLNDVLNLTDAMSWSKEDKLQLESQIVLHNSPPLFLEPTVIETQTSSMKSNTADNVGGSAKYLIEQMLRRFDPSIPTQNESIHDSPVYLPPELSLQQFLAAKRAKRNSPIAIRFKPRFERHKKSC